MKLLGGSHKGELINRVAMTFRYCHDLQVVESSPKKSEGFSPRSVKGETLMPYVRIWVHLIWSTKNRMPLLNDGLRETVLSHMKDNAPEKNIYLDTINGTADHVHALVSLKADQTIAKVAQLMKGELSHWVNDQNLGNGKFEWQDEYIAISVSESMVDKVRDYIRNQEEHHRTKTFSEEYQEFLQKYSFFVRG